MSDVVAASPPDKEWLMRVLMAVVILFIGAFGGALWSAAQSSNSSPWLKDKAAVTLRLNRAEQISSDNAKQIQQLTIQVTRLVAVLEKRP